MELDDLYYVGTVSGEPISKEFAKALWRPTKIIKEARESFDPEPIIDLLAEDAIYESQDTLIPLSGKSEISHYLRRRFSFFMEMPAHQDTGTILFGTIDLPGGSDYPCLIFFVDGVRQALWTVTLEEPDHHMISRIDISTVLPHPDEATLWRTVDVLDVLSEARKLPNSDWNSRFEDWLKA